MRRIALLIIAGSIGTLSRYWMANFVQQLWMGLFPFGTLAVNSLGCFLFGVVWTMAEDRLLFSSETRLIALTGFIGAFTTFSTYMFESTRLIQTSEWRMAILSVLAENVLGFLLVLAGFAVGRLF